MILPLRLKSPPILSGFIQFSTLPSAESDTQPFNLNASSEISRSPVVPSKSAVRRTSSALGIAIKYGLNIGNISDRSSGEKAPSSCKANGKSGSVIISPIPNLPAKLARVPAAVSSPKSLKLIAVESMSRTPCAVNDTPHRSRPLTYNGSLTVVWQL